VSRTGNFRGQGFDATIADIFIPEFGGIVDSEGSTGTKAQAQKGYKT
jgi:hypothetical protein